VETTVAMELRCHGTIDVLEDKGDEDDREQKVMEEKFQIPSAPPHATGEREAAHPGPLPIGWGGNLPDCRVKAGLHSALAQSFSKRYAR